MVIGDALGAIATNFTLYESPGNAPSTDGLDHFLLLLIQRACRCFVRFNEVFNDIRIDSLKIGRQGRLLPTFGPCEKPMDLP